MENRIAGKYDTIADLDASAESHSISEHTVAAYGTVMSEVHIGHDEVVIGYMRASGRIYAQVDDHMLTDYIVVSDIAIGLLAFPAEILRQRTYNGTLKTLLPLPMRVPLSMLA